MNRSDPPSRRKVQRYKQLKMNWPACRVGLRHCTVSKAVAVSSLQRQNGTPFYRHKSTRWQHKWTPNKNFVIACDGSWKWKLRRCEPKRRYSRRRKKRIVPARCATKNWRKTFNNVHNIEMIYRWVIRFPSLWVLYASLCILSSQPCHYIISFPLNNVTVLFLGYLYLTGTT